MRLSLLVLGIRDGSQAAAEELVTLADGIDKQVEILTTTDTGDVLALDLLHVLSRRHWCC